MNMRKFIWLSHLAILSLILTGCYRSSGAVWEDTMSAGRHMNRGIRTLGGKHSNSRQVQRRDEFMVESDGTFAGFGNDFIPLSDDPNASQYAMDDVTMSRPPRETPGDPGSSVPGIEAFRDPSIDPKLAAVFKNIHFGYNSSLIKGQENLTVIREVANYMRKNPRTYIFIEGHCDERGPEAFNLVLGSNRAHSVRNLLISDGANPDNIFTISYGRERPLVVGHDEESWQQNRRAEFKVYER